MLEAFKTWTVTVDGRDVSTAMRPKLIGADIDDQPGMEADAARLRFDDRDGQIIMPPVGKPISIAADGVVIFAGVVDSTPWTLARGEGRILDIVASSVDLRGKAKERQAWHMDDATLADALGKAAGDAGFTITVDPALASIRRDYWSPDGRSFLAWSQELADELGATFKVSGSRAVFAQRGTGLSPNGGPLPSVRAEIGRNVLALRIDVTASRGRYGQAEARWFDREAGEFKSKTVELSADVGAVNRAKRTFQDEGEADSFLEGRRAAEERDAAIGTVEMLFTPEARTEGTLILAGARPGVDGTYRIVSVSHSVTRTEGARTTLGLGQPKVAGDDRKELPGQAPGRGGASGSAGDTSSVRPAGVVG